MSDNKQNAAETPEAGHPDAQQNQKKARKKTASRRNINRKNQLPAESEVTEQFAACGRCSFFWAGYKLIDVGFTVETAVVTDKPGWLHLNYNQSIRDLLYKSFGNRLDLEFYHYAGCCPSCQRPFVFHGGNGNGEQPSLLIRL